MVHHLWHTFGTKEVVMPAKNPRINVVVDIPIYDRLLSLAQKDGVSLSTKVRDLLVEALEIQEDIHLTALAESREESLTEPEILSHEDVWS
jgi:hypothetical protein